MSDLSAWLGRSSLLVRYLSVIGLHTSSQRAAERPDCASLRAAYDLLFWASHLVMASRSSADNRRVSRAGRQRGGAHK